MSVFLFPYKGGAICGKVEARRMATSSELYKRTRNWENLQLATFVNAAGKYDIPKMLPVTECDVKNWISFNFARGTDKEERAETGLHFYLDDYQFQRLWADPERYISLLSSYKAVMSPDFSVYSDFPKAAKIWNVYRNMWLACGCLSWVSVFAWRGRGRGVGVWRVIRLPACRRLRHRDHIGLCCVSACVVGVSTRVLTGSDPAGVGYTPRGYTPGTAPPKDSWIASLTQWT